MDPIDPRAGSVLFVGTATLLVRLAGFTVLTDPNFLHRGEQVRLGFGLRSTRRTEPALGIDDLPPLDLVVLSHLHEDHFDRVAEARLPRALPLVTTPQAARKLRRKGFENAEPLRTWSNVVFRRGPAKLTVTSLTARHGPPVVSAALPATMGSLLDFELSGRRLCRMYVSGDTLVHRRLAEIPERYPDIDLAVLHLGGTRIAGVLLTMDADQGVRMMRTVPAARTLPVHYDDYGVFRSPLADFAERVRAEGLLSRVRWLARGETYEFTAGGAAIEPPPELRI
jgi:L-ascorbate metabolism protein UlaG (beta-lactamase superfamily)